MNIKRVQVLAPDKKAGWMDMAVLNPAIIEYKDKLLMLFRTKGSEGRAWDDPEAIYPIAVGFGVSADGGKTWDFDRSRPALSPECELDIDKVYVINKYGKKVANCANGSIEDPRLFMIEDKCYALHVAHCCITVFGREPSLQAFHCLKRRREEATLDIDPANHFICMRIRFLHIETTCENAALFQNTESLMICSFLIRKSVKSVQRHNGIKSFIIVWQTPHISPHISVPMKLYNC